MVKGEMVVVRKVREGVAGWKAEVVVVVRGEEELERVPRADRN